MYILWYIKVRVYKYMLLCYWLNLFIFIVTVALMKTCLIFLLSSYHFMNYEYTERLWNMYKNISLDICMHTKTDYITLVERKMPWDAILFKSIYYYFYSHKTLYIWKSCTNILFHFDPKQIKVIHNT